MKKIILFDQDIQHYRRDIYYSFKKEFFKIGYTLVVYFDKELNNLESNSLFKPIQFNLKTFNQIVRKENPDIIIQFVWLRYKFILPFMIWSRIRGKKIIVWSHGINLQNKDQPLKNILYYLRQLLADALIIYSSEQKKYIKASHKKLFIANNTLDFDSLPKISQSKHELKLKYGYLNKKLILSVGRFNVNNRKISHLIHLSRLLDKDFQILIIGTGINEKDINEIEHLDNIKYFGAIYDQKKLCEFYKMADLFIMPGAVGLALNQAQYFDTPAILENVDHGPEKYYLIKGYNGLLYEPNNINDLKNKVLEIFDANYYEAFAKNAKQTQLEHGSFDKMLKGFKDAIEYVRNKN